MHDWLGTGLITLGLGLIVAGIVKHRTGRERRSAWRDPPGVRCDGGDGPAADPVRRSRSSR